MFNKNNASTSFTHHAYFKERVKKEDQIRSNWEQIHGGQVQTGEKQPSSQEEPCECVRKSQDARSVISHQGADFKCEAPEEVEIPADVSFQRSYSRQADFQREHGNSFARNAYEKRSRCPEYPAVTDNNLARYAESVKHQKVPGLPLVQRQQAYTNPYGQAVHTASDTTCMHDSERNETQEHFDGEHEEAGSFWDKQDVICRQCYRSPCSCAHLRSWLHGGIQKCGPDHVLPPWQSQWEGKNYGNHDHGEFGSLMLRYQMSKAPTAATPMDRMYHYGVKVGNDGRRCAGPSSTLCFKCENQNSLKELKGIGIRHGAFPYSPEEPLPEHLRR